MQPCGSAKLGAPLMFYTIPRVPCPIGRGSIANGHPQANDVCFRIGTDKRTSGAMHQVLDIIATE